MVQQPRSKASSPDSAGRDGILEGDLAFDVKGNFLALRMRILSASELTRLNTRRSLDDEHEELPVECLPDSRDRH